MPPPDGGRTDSGVPSTGVTVVPAAAHAAPGGTVAFTALVTGESNMAVTWSVQEGAPGGTIDPSGTYTAPTSPGTFHVVATSQANAALKGGATVFVALPGTCATLPSSSAWEQITPPSVDNTASVIVDPFDPATVWLGTGLGSQTTGVFKSSDCGVTWTLVSTGMNAAMLGSGDMWSMAVDPVDQGVLYSLSGYGSEGLWKSTNGGVDWTQLFPMGSQYAQLAPYAFVNNVTMDPTNHLHLLVLNHGACNAPYDIGCEAETFDGGKNWTITATPQPWGEGGGVQLLNGTSWLWGGGEGGSGTYLTTDNGANFTQVLPPGQGDVNGSTIKPVTPASDGALYVSSMQGPVRSTDGGKTWSLIKVGRVVGFTVSKTGLFACDQWSPTFYKASMSDPTTWSTMPAPPLPMNQGCSWMDYDEAHHVLYVSCLTTAAPFQPVSSGAPGSVWRILAP
jgi:hypothetical protein